MDKIILITIMLYTFFAYVKESKKYIPEGEYNNKAFYNHTDTVEKILSRIEWAALYNTRVNYLLRYSIYSLLISLISSYIIIGSLPSLHVYFQLWVCIIIILYSFHGYYNWHRDKFTQYSILNNIHKIREIFDYKKTDIDTSFYVSSNHEQPWIYTYNDYKMNVLNF